MSLKGSLECIFDNVSFFLNQNDLCALCLVNRRFNELATPKLYANIVINKNPVYRSNNWWIESGKTYLSGYRSVKKSDDQNDLFLYDRIERLLESQHLELVQSLIIQEDVFNDMKVGAPLLRKLIDKVIELDRVEDLDIRDSILFQNTHNKLKVLTNLKALRIRDIAGLNDISHLRELKSLELFVTLPSFDDVILSEPIRSLILPNLEELVIEDLEYSSLRVLNYFREQGVVFSNLKSLKFNHVHGIHDYNKTYRELAADLLMGVIPLETIHSLEMEISCEVNDCTCIDDFLADISPHLIRVNNL